MRDRSAEVAAAGGAIALIGSGSPEQAARFADAWAQGLPVYSDAGRGAFAAAGLKRSLFSSLHPRLFLNLFRALRRGFRQTRVEGDPWQQGGVLVVEARQPHALVHSEVDAVGGDSLDVEAVIAAMRNVG